MYELLLLGTLRLESAAGRAVGRVAQRRRLALLAALALAGPRGMSRDRLQALFWPDSPADAARHLLSDSLYVIRRELGADAILGAGEELRLNEDVVRSDVALLDAAFAAGELERVATLYQGPLLDGVHLAGSAELEQWIDTERARLARRHAEALAGLATEREAAGDAAGAVVWLRRLAAADPFDSVAATRLVRALAAAGDSTGALRHARAHEVLLREELGIASPPDLERAVADVPARAAEARTKAPEDAAPGTDRPAGAGAGRPPVVSPPSEPLRRTGAPGDPARTVRRRRFLHPRLAGAGAVVLLGVAGAVAVARDRGGSPAAGGEQAVAVFPFAVSGADPERISEATHVLLSTRIDGAEGVVALNPGTVAARLPAGRLSPERAVTLAASLGAASMVLGDIVAANGRVEITATRYTTARRPARTAHATVSGAASDIFGLVDRLAAQLLVPDGEPATALARTAALTTASLPALRLFLQGDADYRAGRHAAAAAAYADAIARDSGFALAYQRLAVAQEWSAGGDGGRAAIRAAQRLSDRLPPRSQVLVEAHAARLERDFPRAELLYRRLLGLYPDDADGWNGLGEVLFHGNPERGRSWLEAREPFERARMLGLRAGGEPLFHLIAIAATEERAGAVAALAREYLALRGDDFLAAIVRAQHAVIGGDADEFARAAAQLRQLSWPEARFAIELVALTTRRLAASERMLAAVDHPATADVHLLRARLAAAAWRWRTAADALAAAERLGSSEAVELRALLASLPFAAFSTADVHAAAGGLRSLPPDSARAPLRLHLLGALHARVGDADSARAAAHALAALGAPAALARAAVLLAEVERRAGNTAAALALLRPELAAAAGPEFRLLRAELLVQTGAPHEAIDWLHAAQAHGDAIPYLTQIEARLAQAYRGAGRHGEAALFERRFAALRGTASPR